MIYMLLLISGIAFSNPHERVADAYYSQRNFPEAVFYYTRAIAENPDDAILYYKRARTYLFSNQYEAYNRDIQKALELDPQLAGKLPDRELTDGRGGDEFNDQQSDDL